MISQRWLRVVGRSVQAHSPAILSGAAVAGVVATAVLAVKNHRSAMIKLADAEAEREEKAHDEAYKKASEAQQSILEPKVAPFTVVEKALIVWQSYIPVVLTGAATVACIIGANQIGARRSAALLGAYTLAETTLAKYKDEIAKQFGETKSTAVSDAVTQRTLDEHPLRDKEVVFLAGGDQLCFETLTGRYFKSDIETLRRAENDFNAQLLDEFGLSWNDWYHMVGLAPVRMGDELGWNVERRLEIQFKTQLADNGQPCLVLDYINWPRADFGKF